MTTPEKDQYASPHGTDLRESTTALSCFLPQPFPRQRLLHSLFFSRFQEIRMSFDFLNDVFLLYFAFETAKRTFQVLAFLKSDFSHSIIRLQSFSS